MTGDSEARRLATELDDALKVLSTFDEGPDLVLYYKYLMVLEGHPEYEHHFIESDCTEPESTRIRPDAVGTIQSVVEQMAGIGHLNHAIDQTCPRH